MKSLERSFKFAFYFNLFALAWNVVAGAMSVYSHSWKMLLLNITFTIISGACAIWVQKMWQEEKQNLIFRHHTKEK